jgi:hypothetical protein
MRIHMRIKRLQWLLAASAALAALFASMVSGALASHSWLATQSALNGATGPTLGLAQARGAVRDGATSRSVAGSHAAQTPAGLAGQTGPSGGAGQPAPLGTGGVPAPIPSARQSSLYGVSIVVNSNEPGWKFIPYTTYSQMGATWVRLEATTNAPYQTLTDPQVLRSYQTLFSQLHAASLKIMILLDYDTLGAEYDARNQVYPWQCFLETIRPPAINCNGFKGTAQEYDNDMAQQAGVLANLGVDAPDAYEVWNEPDNPKWYVPPQVYTGLYHAVQSAVHAVAGSGPVVTGGLNMAIDVQSPDKAGSWSSQTSVFATADVVALHPYGYVSHNYCQCYPRAGWLDTVDTSWTRFLRAQGNWHAPLWFTEYNYTWQNNIDNPVNSALGIQDVYSWAKANGVRVFWFSGQDNPPGVAYLGIFTAAGTPTTLSTPVMCGGPRITEEGVYQASAAGLC